MRDKDDSHHANWDFLQMNFSVFVKLIQNTKLLLFFFLKEIYIHKINETDAKIYINGKYVRLKVWSHARDNEIG